MYYFAHDCKHHYVSVNSDFSIIWLTDQLNKNKSLFRYQSGKMNFSLIGRILLDLTVQFSRTLILILVKGKAYFLWCHDYFHLVAFSRKVKIEIPQGLLNVKYIVILARDIGICRLGWAQWNLSRFEFKSDDTRLSL